ncbi:hypothetical protein DFH01_21325 [Falsiroseomonas bella]|uniref:Uncharacterized protein n=1 Tax=Falsiroseomonas bella TaxID=2184016 RepID=A0A317F778_9PROT|nr:hypothetical protein DFH01_21325 [Falsiroseomonas bella]
MLGNIEKVGAALGPWLAPEAGLEVIFEGPAGREVTVAVVGGRVFESHVFAGTGGAVFSVPANARYTVAWQGVGYKPGEVGSIIVPTRPQRWRLAPAGREENQDLLALRAENAASPEPSSPASAAILVASTVPRGPADAPGGDAALLPEIDRALSVVGLFEMGTTLCSRRVMVSQFGIAVGCLAMSLPGPAAGIIRRLDERHAALLDAVLGDEAGFIRDLASRRPLDLAPLQPLAADASRRARLSERLEALAATAEFRIEQQVEVLEWYRRALVTARAFGLRSERGVLFVFDRLVSQGFAWPDRIRAAYEAAVAPDATEAARLAALAAASAARLSGPTPPAVAARLRDRMQIIATGKGTIRGVAFDLDVLGIRADAPMAGMGAAPAGG